jgi:cytochrome c-type biogenesis protein CcmE
MTRKRRRLYFLLAGMAALGLTSAGTFYYLTRYMEFFRTPSEIAASPVAPGRAFRIGGLVANGSVVKASDGLSVKFRITDLKNEIPVSYTGTLPDLFREGQGVVAEGALQGDGTFIATSVLAKHDEKYMPPAVVEELKKSGQWRPGPGPQS